MKLKKQDGITLVEILTALAILGFVFFAFSHTYIAGRQAYDRNQERIEFQQLHRVINSRIAPYVRIANHIEWNPANQELKLTFPSTREVNAREYNAITFGIDNTDLYYERDWYNPTISSNKMRFVSGEGNAGVRDMLVEFDDNNGVLKIQMTIVSEHDNTYTFTENFYPRLLSLNNFEIVVPSN
ncbi:type II secretion system protein [Natronospora cellulosivora (SeqCode)]